MSAVGVQQTALRSRPCADCNGTGRLRGPGPFHVGVSHIYVCGVCDGTGRIESDPVAVEVERQHALQTGEPQ